MMANLDLKNGQNPLNSLKVEIADSEVKRFEGISSKTNKGFLIRTQTAYFHTPNEIHPLKFQISLMDDQEAYDKGFYFIDLASFYLTRFNGLGFRVCLKPVN